MERVAQVLKRAQRPVEFAVKAATGAIHRDDDATLAAVQRFLEQQPSETAAAEYVEGLRWQHQDDFGKAAEHFRLAARQAKEDDERKDYFEYFLAAMAHAGQAAQGFDEGLERRFGHYQLRRGTSYREAKACRR